MGLGAADKRSRHAFPIRDDYPRTSHHCSPDVVGSWSGANEVPPREAGGSRRARPHDTLVSVIYQPTVPRSWVMDRKSSIEEEPRTLGADQLRFAREAALYVLNSMSVEEALRVFTHGLEPVAVDGWRRDDEGFHLNPIASGEMADEDVGRGGFAGPRDIVSAPF
ncbi:hypothetical protein MLD38_020431 [Melastoma candidum]|uniref:Uncharacterized protein n=1 Tax=Melastoma candidum TaxID=119954 RepID=A0ACB9QDU9_9MYRT|nr:hypothetical protein MLD38_020431 [Melastoma candidum]